MADSLYIPTVNVLMRQDLGLELQKRNITQQREATKKEVDDGLESLPGVSSATTFVPSSDLTPRDVSRCFRWCYRMEGGEFRIWNMTISSR